MWPRRSDIVWVAAKGEVAYVVSELRAPHIPFILGRNGVSIIRSFAKEKGCTM